MPLVVMAKGGISVSGTRIIYPKESRQEIVSVRNSSATNSFLVQSWVENAAGEKQGKFVVTPPLYLSSPGNENKLRLIFTKVIHYRMTEKRCIILSTKRSLSQQ
jgi:fimbrial chaperone protein